jgi:hypothetical protein
LKPLFIPIVFLILLSPLAAQAQRAESNSPRTESSPQRSDAPPRRESYSDRYSILSDHNIFLRDRSRPASSHATSQPATTKLPEESLVLTGVVMEDDGFRAYIENAETSSITKVALGDTIGRGRVVDLQINAVQYEHGSERIWIEMGCNFLGHASTLSTTSSSAATTAPSGASSTQPTSLPFNPNDPNLTLEQKMKLRRLQERK